MPFHKWGFHVYSTFPIEDLVMYHFLEKNVRYSITIKEGSEIIGLIRLDRAKVLFVTKEIEGPVDSSNFPQRRLKRRRY